MAVIGRFTLGKDGVWHGSIRTLALKTPARFVVNENHKTEFDPRYRLVVGQSRIGDAWEAQSLKNPGRIFYRVRVDDPTLHEPITAFLFPDEFGDRAELVWTRRRE